MSQTNIPEGRHGELLLMGVVGSTAYGLAGPDSDVDFLGVYACSTEMLHGLGQPTGTISQTNPDVTIHEVGKWCRLALGCNPTVMELVWLTEYTVITDLGAELVEIRRAFLSRRRVRDAYLGYATQQLRKLEQHRNVIADSVCARRRAEKHARHLLRLLDQGLALYSEGHLTVRVSDPQRYRDFGEAVAAGDLALANAVFGETKAAFAEWESSTPLPEKPHFDTVAAWLQRVRRVHLGPT